MSRVDQTEPCCLFSFIAGFNGAPTRQITDATPSANRKA